MMGMAAGMMLWMLLACISVVALVIVGVLVVARKHSGDVSVSTRQRDGAVEVLRHRLAAGEIDDEEYLRRRSVLE